ncbi:MAG: Uma2 family endonuclease [Polyangiaceae bacterium]|nr:Uma2 family endonuclease [Polyangiaceae bacterium]
MAQLRLPQVPRSLPALRYVRAPEPLVFPAEEEVPEGYVHLVVRTFLFELLGFALGPEHSVGSDQLVYWNASNPKRKLAPDVFVRLGTPQREFPSWKVWEQGGVPQLAVEIISPDEGDGVSWEEKLARYHELGMQELVRFDPEEAEGHRLRAWDRVREDLVERVVAGDRTPCLTLGLNWTVRAIAARSGNVLGLRLIDDAGRLLETRQEVDARRRAEADARAQSAEARIEELEAELARLRDKPAP